MCPRRSISHGLTVSRPESMNPDSSRAGGPRLVGRAVPLHQARLDGPAERRGHRDRFPRVEVHVPLRDGERRAETPASRVEELVTGAHDLAFAADEPALGMDEVALQELRLEAPDRRHRGEGAPIVPGVDGPGSHLVEQVEDAVGNPLEVVGDGEVLEGVALPRLHHAAKGLAPAVLAHRSYRLRCFKGLSAAVRSPAAPAPFPVGPACATWRSDGSFRTVATRRPGRSARRVGLAKRNPATCGGAMVVT